MATTTNRRVLITGIGPISPLGMTSDAVYDSLVAGRSGVTALTDVQPESFPFCFGGQVTEFKGYIEDFGPLGKEQKKGIRKGLKLMCREIQLAVAAAQRALADAELQPGDLEVERSGVVFGSDYMVTVPTDMFDGFRHCATADGQFNYELWGAEGMSQVTPLWLLKYLPNMPASHIAIYNDLRGPSNSITMREASSNLSLAEAYCTIERGRADVMLAGATGTRLHPLRRIHATTQEQLGNGEVDPARVSRPFDLHRTGLVLGEGAGAVVLEEKGRAELRGAKIYGEIAGYGSSFVAERQGTGHCTQAVVQAIRMALRTADMTPDDVGHVHAHGLSTQRADAAEAQAIHFVFSDCSRRVPVVAAKSHFGNLGAGSGMVEIIASMAAIQRGRLFPVLNYQTPDPDCPVAVVTGKDAGDPGTSVLNINFTPQGQASAVLVTAPVG